MHLAHFQETDKIGVREQTIGVHEHTVGVH